MRVLEASRHFFCLKKEISRCQKREDSGSENYSLRAIAPSSLEAPDEGVGSARRPQAVELGCVPDSLVCQLRHTNGVRGWTRWSVGEAVVLDCVEHVGLVVRAVEVLSIPATIRTSLEPIHMPIILSRLLTRGNGGQRKCCNVWSQ